jgi:prolyl oligopeptidase
MRINGFMRIRLLLLSLPLIVLVQCQPAAEAPPPPETTAIPVTDSLHGVEMVDPYRWLEDQESPETRSWIDAQNTHTDGILDPLPGREPLTRRITELMKVDEISTPFERGGRFFYSRRGADQELSVYYWRDGLEGEEQMLVDPHPMSDDHTVSVNLQDVTPDGKLALYGVRHGGVDEIEVKFLDVDSGELLPDALPAARYYGVSMMPDKSGFYYTRRGPEGPRLYYRARGSDPASEELIFGAEVEPQYFVGGEVTDDGRWLVMTIRYGWNKSDIYLKNLTSDGDIVAAVAGEDAYFDPSYEDGKLFIHTNWQAPNWRLMAADPAKLSTGNWREVIPERDGAVLEGVTAAGGKLFARYLENVQSRIVIFDAAGKELGDIGFDEIGTVGSVVGDWASDVAFYSFQSFHIPRTIYNYSVPTGESEVWAQDNVPFESDGYEVEQVWYESKDGTDVPMFITHGKGIELDGSHPTFLTAYGGFNASLTPSFSARVAIWLESGGVYAVPNLRGGGEFGEAWHRAGMLENKQNVFDDFIAAAEYLIEKGYTRTDKLAIRGGSNGGLLVTAVMTQRPDLYGAVICTYPLIDMVRYHKFLVGSTWAPEYGSADDPEQFDYIYAYSPYQHVVEGTDYPPILFITGDRVGRAGHSPVPHQGRPLRRSASQRADREHDRDDAVSVLATRHGRGYVVTRTANRHQFAGRAVVNSLAATAPTVPVSPVTSLRW